MYFCVYGKDRRVRYLVRVDSLKVHHVPDDVVLVHYPVTCGRHDERSLSVAVSVMNANRSGENERTIHARIHTHTLTPPSISRAFRAMSRLLTQEFRLIILHMREHVRCAVRSANERGGGGGV